MPTVLASVDWKQAPNRREQILFVAVLVLLMAGFLKTCWFPSRHAITIAEAQLTTFSAASVPLSAPEVSATLPSDVPAGTCHETLRLITDMSSLRGIQLTGSAFSDLEQGGGSDCQRAELKLSGSFSGIGRYLHLLEEAPAPLVVDTLTFAATEGDWTKLVVEIKGTIHGR